MPALDRVRLRLKATLGIAAFLLSGMHAFAAGTAALPGLAFFDDTDSGVYSYGANEVGIAAGGTLVARFVSGGVIVPGDIELAGAIKGNGGVEFYALPTTTGTDLVVTGLGIVSKKSSSRRYKENEQLWTGDSRNLLALEPKTFDYKGDGAKGVLFFIAEDVADIDPIYVNTDAEGQPESIRTDSLVAALIDLVQQQERRIAALEARLS